ncbi:DUF1707 SHOCT-like domain-containing protein [Nocardioides lianchengensis]|uniref:DUF1707 domain-containing protein n=1 Tax=Nocardioides lianchengensis TaxID=1045774 RepID=A0A1G6V775_9ACTN|nr:DUF1707 domain-containing protein [Nocardioides lianchengensis]NYG11146.1 hypothetical protein [Nocardioides lianchengensis]SDD48847.1 protein of unknown function [Nocardioides lianchengensis]
MIEPHQQRISDDDRHRTAEFLRQAAGEGRIDLEELDERLEAAYAAKVYGDLVPLVVDLPGAEAPLPTGLVPAPRPGQLPAPTGAPRYGTSIAVMSGTDRKGVWEVPPIHTAFTMMGGVDIDLREAVFTTPEVVITANAVMGAVDVIVNAWTRVTVEGVGIMGTFEEGRAKVDPEIGPASPHVRVRGVALMGAVTVVRKPMPGEKRKRLRRASD